jgi:hypothetical protein
LLLVAPSLEEALADVTLGSLRLQATRSNVLAMTLDQKGIENPISVSDDGGGGEIAPIEPQKQEERAKGRADAYRPTMMKPRTVDRVVTRKFLTSITQRLEDAGVKVAWIGAPQASQLDGLDGPESIYPEYEAFVRELAAQLGVEFHDMRHVGGVTNVDFIDADHLSRDGAVKFSRALAEQVVLPEL